MEFGASVLGTATPADCGLGVVAADLVRIDGSNQRRSVAVASPEAVSGQYAELNFRHVESTGMSGSVVEFETLHDAAGFGGRKGLVERSHGGCSGCPGPRGPQARGDR
jgi:hypothetical protein